MALSASDRDLYQRWLSRASAGPPEEVARAMPGVTLQTVRNLRAKEPAKLVRATRNAMIAYLEDLRRTVDSVISAHELATGRGRQASKPMVVRENHLPYGVSHLDEQSRVWIQEFALRLTKAGVPDDEIDEARMLLGRSHLTDYLTGGAEADRGLAPDDRLLSLKAVAEHVIIPTLRRRGRKVSASLAR
jgi:hypothetical protein